MAFNRNAVRKVRKVQGGVQPGSKYMPFIKELLLEYEGQVQQVAHGMGWPYKYFHLWATRNPELLKVVEAYKLAEVMGTDPDMFYYLLHKTFGQRL